MNESYFPATGIYFNGCGILIVGKSGSGKSSLALAFLDQGASLISDDVTHLILQEGKVIARAPLSIQGALEVRQIGILRVDQQVQNIPIQMVVELTEQEIERYPLELKTYSLLGVNVPLFQFRKFEFALTNKVVMAIKIIRNEIHFWDETHSKDLK